MRFWSSKLNQELNQNLL